MESSTKTSALVLILLPLFISATTTPILAECGHCRKHKHHTKVKPPVIPILPPIVPGNTPCPPPPGPASPAPATCPVDTLKLGACVDLLGGLVHGIVGDPVVNKCCPVLGGLLDLEAAVCLCTTIKLRLLSIKIYLPLALKLLITCGKNPPPDFTCTV